MSERSFGEQPPIPADPLPNVAEMQVQVEQFAALVENSADIIGVATMEGRPFFINRTGRKLLGLHSQDDVARIPLNGFYTKETWRRIQTEAMPLIRRRGRWKGEGQLRHPRTGDLIDVEIIVFVVTHPQTGESLCIATVQRDIRLRKRAEEALARAREREVEIAAKIQKTLLLPPVPPVIPGIRISACSFPSHRIDGDYYDLFALGDDCLDVLVGDVMGTGIPAALLAAASKGHFQRVLRRLIVALERHGRLPEPEEVIHAVHHILTRELLALDSFLTLCYMRFDLARRRVVFVDCGHPRVIRFRSQDGSCSLLEGHNLPFGISMQEIYRQVTEPLESGDRFLLYSDGVTEARNAEGELFGVTRLMETVQTHAMREPEDLQSAVQQAVMAFTGEKTFSDDLTSVAIYVDIPETARALRREAVEIVGQLSEIARARAFVGAACRKLANDRLTMTDVEMLRLVVNEAVVNIIQHGYGGDTERTIEIEALADTEAITFRLLDRGIPFNPEGVGPPILDGSRERGFGLYIMRQCVDSLSYQQDDLGRNCLTLIRRFGRADALNPPSS